VYRRSQSRRPRPDPRSGSVRGRAGKACGASRRAALPPARLTRCPYRSAV
jgi:hypothetical protein